MKRPAAFKISLALGVAILIPGLGARAEPTAITACQTISQPGSYRLANNLTATIGGDCLVITTDDVTIDLAGFSITGSGAGTGIAAAPPSGVLQGIAVRNGSITRFLAGVDLFSGLGPALGSIVEGLRVSHTIITGIRATGIVTRNTVLEAGPRGSGMIVTGVVTWNNVSNNGGEGIQALPGSTLIGNTANDNGLDGILAICPVNLTDNTAIGNAAADRGAANIRLQGDGCHNEDNVAP